MRSKSIAIWAVIAIVAFASLTIFVSGQSLRPTPYVSASDKAATTISAPVLRPARSPPVYSGFAVNESDSVMLRAGNMRYNVTPLFISQTRRQYVEFLVNNQILKVWAGGFPVKIATGDFLHLNGISRNTVYINVSQGNRTTCTVPHDGIIITNDTVFCRGTYRLLGEGIKIYDSAVLDCNESTFLGGITLTGKLALFNGTFNYGPFGIRIGDFGRPALSDVEVKNCKMKGFPVAMVALENPRNLDIHDNEISDCSSGIDMYATDSKAYDNYIHDGIHVGINFGHRNNMVYNNRVEDFMQTYTYMTSYFNGETWETRLVSSCPGIGIQQGAPSDGNIIRNNDIRRMCLIGINVVGMPPQPSLGCSVKHNYIEEALWTGIAVQQTNFTIAEYNDVYKSGIYSTYLYRAHDSDIDHNNFVKSNQPPLPSDWDGSNNVWSTNYYSDTSPVCTDNDGDGICDDARSIFGTTGSIDYTPSRFKI